MIIFNFCYNISSKLFLSLTFSLLNMNSKNIFLATTITLSFISIFLAITLIKSIKKNNIDPLSNLGNRRVLYKYLSRIIKNKFYSIAFIDLDNFKKINDSFGHNIGDQVIQLVSTELQNYSKKHPKSKMKSFRIGGDEFVLVFKNKEFSIDTFLNDFKGIHINDKGRKGIVRGSIGIINLNLNLKKDINYILNLTDFAMLKAKDNGKNQVVIIDDEIINQYNFFNNIKNKFEHSLDKKEIKYSFVNINNATNNSSKGFNLIGNWKVDNQYILSSTFLKYIHNHYDLIAYDMYMLNNLCSEIIKLKKTNSSKLDKLFSIKLSPTTIKEVELSYFKDAIKKYDLSTSDVTLEVSADLLLYENQFSKIKFLSNQGFNFIVSNFNTSLSYINKIKDLNIKLVKINPTIIKETASMLSPFDETDFEKILYKSTFFKNIIIISKLTNISFSSKKATKKEEVFLINTLIKSLNNVYKYSTPTNHPEIY